MRNKYKKIISDGKVIDEHRVVMERVLERKLLKNEVVHHINGIKNDNRVENLQVMDRIEHAKLKHNIERGLYDKKITLIFEDPLHQEFKIKCVK